MGGDKKPVINKCSTITNRFICDNKPDCKWNSTDINEGNCTINEQYRTDMLKQLIKNSKLSRSDITEDKCNEKIPDGITGIPYSKKDAIGYIINNNDILNKMINCSINETDGKETGCKIEKDKLDKSKFICVKNSWES
jgi:hypothetical protein